MVRKIRMRMAGVRANDRTLAAWTRKAKMAGMSFNAWARLVLDDVPEMKPVDFYKWLSGTTRKA